MAATRQLDKKGNFRGLIGYIAIDWYCQMWNEYFVVTQYYCRESYKHGTRLSSGKISKYVTF